MYIFYVYILLYIYMSKWARAKENTLYIHCREDVKQSIHVVIFNREISINGVDWYFQAVCCSDHIHCCPTGYTCDPAQGICESDLGLMPLFDKKPAKKNGARRDVSRWNNMSR